MSAIKTFLLCAIFLASNLAVLSMTSEAEACDPAQEELSWTLPEEGGTIQSRDQILLVTVGSAYTQQVVRLLDDGGSEWPMTLESRQIASLFGQVYEVLPDDPLEAGDYSVVFEEEETGDALDVGLNFTVTDEDLGTNPVPEAVDFEWYQETYEEATGNSCDYGDEYNQLIIEPLADEPAYYEMYFSPQEDASTVHLMLPEEVDGTLKSFFVTDVDCVMVYGVEADGTQGPATQHCEPQKCIHYEAPLQGSVGSTDWNDVAGCEEGGVIDPDPDAGSGGDDVGTGGDAGTWVDPEPQPDAGTNSDVGIGGDVGSTPDSEDDEGGCATAPGSTPPTSLLVLVVMMLGVRRFRTTAR